MKIFPGNLNKKVAISNEIFKCLLPILKLSRAFGLSPYTLQRKPNESLVALSWKYISYGYMLILLIVSATAYGLKEYYKIDVVYKTRMKQLTDRYVTYADIATAFLPTMIAVSYTPIRWNKVGKYLTCLIKIDKLIEVKSNKNQTCIILIVVSMSVCTVILSVDMWLWVNIAKEGASVISIVLHLIPYYVAYYFTLIIELNYWHMVHLVKIRLQTLNENLSVAKDQEKRVTSLNNFRDNNVNKQQISKIIDNLTHNVLKEQNIVKSNVFSKKYVANLMKVYELIYDATTAVNEFYGLIILVVLIGCLIHLLVTPYCLYLQVKNTNQPFFIASQLFWMLCHVLRLIIIVEPCDICKVETTTTGVLICKLLLSTQNEDTKTQLELFATQLSHCRIEFTANGLTKIDRHLLTAITGAVTTYLVILFQFNNV